MPGKEASEEVELRRKKQKESFSNYENAVTLICSLEAWLEHRWGRHGKVRPGLLAAFNRFPDVDGMTPDFEARFHTPYIIWGDHKRTIQPSTRGRDEAVEQILRYAMRASEAPVTAPSEGERATDQDDLSRVVNYDVLVLVSSENDDVAADAINAARIARQAEVPPQDLPPRIAPIVVLGCHLDRESLGEWYKVKWRPHHDNSRFSVPNISTDHTVEDLNALIVDRSHHAIPVNRPALGRTGRNPFINDTPPAIYTAVRLAIPAINSLLSEDERDHLQSTGRVEKTLSKQELLDTELVQSIRPQPRGLGKWIEAALEFLASELKCAKKLMSSDPVQYVVTIDSTLIKGDLRELFSERAARVAAKEPGKSRRGRKGRRGGFDQMNMFE